MRMQHPTVVELCIAKALKFLVSNADGHWTAWMLFLSSPVHWDMILRIHIGIILTYPCFVKNQAAWHQKDGAWRPLKPFGQGTLGPNKRMNLPRASVFFWRRTSFLEVYARSRQLGFTFGALRHPFILDGRWSLAASHCNLGSVAG